MKTTNAAPSTSAPLSGLIAAFAAVYVIWGSTYLGIRYAIESIPPFLMAGSRFVAAGALIYGFARLRGAARPTDRQWRDAFVAGGLMLMIGNGGVTWAEQVVPSSVAALLAGLVPVWMVLLDWLRPGGVRPKSWVILGLGIGFAGVALLVGGDARIFSPAYGWGIAALLAASIGWAVGSLFNRHAQKPKSPLLGVALQMIAGGSLLLTVGVLRGEVTEFAPVQITLRSWAAWLYLTVAGSMIGYSAYVWLLHATTPARVATYAYVNPLIAVLLGCTIGQEAFSREFLLAGVLIVMAVVLIVRGGTPSKAARAEDSVEATQRRDAASRSAQPLASAGFWGRKT